MGRLLRLRETRSFAPHARVYTYNGHTCANNMDDRASWSTRTTYSTQAAGHPSCAAAPAVLSLLKKLGKRATRRRVGSACCCFESTRSNACAFHSIRRTLLRISSDCLYTSLLSTLIYCMATYCRAAGYEPTAIRFHYFSTVI